MNVIEGRIELASSDYKGVVVDLEVVVEGVIELAPRLVRSGFVQVCRTGCELDVGAEPLGAELKFCTGVGQPCLDSPSLDLYRIAAIQDFASGEESVGGKVDQPLLADVEPLELLRQTSMDLAGQ